MNDVFASSHLVTVCGSLVLGNYLQVAVFVSLFQLTVLTTTQAMLMGQWRKPSNSYEELKKNDLLRILKDQKGKYVERKNI